jgi:hypothetical protein
MFWSAKQHLTENNMTYIQHLRFAVFYSFVCLIASICLLVHAIFPGWLQTTGSDLVKTLSLVFRKSQP